MKYTLFLFFGLLCIIELNALLLSKSPVKISTQSTNNAHTKKETSTKEIKGKTESNKPSSTTKTSKDQITKLKTTDPRTRITDPRTKTTDPRTKTTDPRTKTTDPRIKTTDPRKITDKEKKKILDKLKEKLKEKIKHTMTEEEIKKIKDDLKKKHPLTHQEIKNIIDDLRKKKAHPINTDPIMKKIISQLKRKRPITDPAIQNLLEKLKIKHKLTDPEMKNLMKELQKRTNNPVVKPTGPVKTTLPKNQNQESTKKIIDFLRSKLGCGYAFGSEGQKLTPELLRYFKNNFGSNVKDSTSKWMNKECYDCSGLSMKALQEAGIKVHHNAQATWANDLKQRGDINSIPTDKLCLVFKKGSNGEMHHIGIYIGNGKVIEAKGADYGVVETDLKGGNWTNWGIPAGLE